MKRPLLGKNGGTGNGAVWINTAFDLIGDFTVTVADRNDLSGIGEMGLFSNHGAQGWTDVFFVENDKIYSNIVFSHHSAQRKLNNSRSTVKFRIQRAHTTILEQFDDGTGGGFQELCRLAVGSEPVQIGLFLLQEYSMTSAHSGSFDNLVITAE